MYNANNRIRCLKRLDQVHLSTNSDSGLSIIAFLIDHSVFVGLNLLEFPPIAYVALSALHDVPKILEGNGDRAPSPP